MVTRSRPRLMLQLGLAGASASTQSTGRLVTRGPAHTHFCYFTISTPFPPHPLHLREESISEERLSVQDADLRQDP
jgi:hypothetical protein